MALTPSASTASAPSAATDEPAGRWVILSLLGVTQFLGMSLWFTASATASQLAALWGLDASTAAGLTMAVQVGFVAGTGVAAVLNLADLVPARVYVAVAALLAAGANYSLALAGGPDTALASRFLTGFCLAGVYPPAMKMAATWFRASRGLAIGVIVGALTVGKAAPYLVGAFADLDYRFVLTTTSAGAVVAAALVLFGYRDGPFAFERRPFSWSLAGVILRHRPSRLAIGAYLGHMWELYACWAALSLFFLHYFLARGFTDAQATLYAGLVTFSAIAAGGPGSILAGTWADRWGRENVAGAALAVSGACALTIGWLGAATVGSATPVSAAASGAPAVLVIGLALVWGFAVVADSAQFSALVTEVAPPHAVGTALTLQTSLGFLLTAFTIWLTFELQDLFGWGVAFSVLALGPTVGIWQLRLLRNR
ncbi:MAG TPA: MFS transporter [Longimicrobiales bacterium]|nr:MFS transporter [Longimicrobiales bacterium]